MKRFSCFLRGLVCIWFNDIVLFEKLKDIGGFNFWYVVINWIEVMKFLNFFVDRNFVVVIWFLKLYIVKVFVSYYLVGKKIGKREVDNLFRVVGIILD